MLRGLGETAMGSEAPPADVSEPSVGLAECGARRAGHVVRAADRGAAERAAGDLH